MFMDWTKEDKEESVRWLRLVLGVPTMTVVVPVSLGVLVADKQIILPWDPAAFLAGCGLALALKLIEVIIYKIREH
jgi:hypothetical protein